MSIPYDYDQTNIDHLRAVIDEQDQTIKYLHERCKAEEVVNAKLRELMSVMAYCIQGWRECDGCRVNGGAGIITERAGCDVLLDRLRELGVEVE